MNSIAARVRRITPGGPTERLAAGLWIAAAVLYLGSEALAAAAFSPPYSYAQNYISDLGVPDCGIVYDGRAICSPLHGLMNADLVLQGLLFTGAALAIVRSLTTPTRFVLVAFAALNGIGNILVGSIPESAVRLAGSVNGHVLGAVLAIVFGNAAALMSAASFRTLRLPRLFLPASIGLPLLAGVALAMLAVGRHSGTPTVFPDGVWERMSVYTITAWEVLAAACLLGRKR